MRELLKIVNKRMYLLLFILGIIFSVAQSGQSVFLAVFATSPLNEKNTVFIIKYCSNRFNNVGSKLVYFIFYDV